MQRDQKSSIAQRKGEGGTRHRRERITELFAVAIVHFTLLIRRGTVNVELGTRLSLVFDGRLLISFLILL